MTLRLRLFSLLCALLFSIAQLQAQIFTGTSSPVTSPALNAQFTACEVYQIDVAAFDAYVKNSPSFSQSELHFGNHHWKIELAPSGIMKENYALQMLTPGGLEVVQPTPNKAFKGIETSGGGKVALTVDDDYIGGFVAEGGDTWYIEPYRYYDPSASDDLFVVYERKAVIPNTDGTCLVLDEEGKAKELLNDHHDGDEQESEKLSQACYEVDIALADDKLMFDKYGSVDAVENHNITVLNNVQTNFLGEFNHDLEFVIATIFVVTTTDPWTNSNDAGTLLNSFRNWGNAGNFGVTFDVASLWTNRDFNGGTVGIAYLSGVCNSNKYNCLQDFTSNAELLRVLQAHELGHNFSAGHDASGCPGMWIMCPSVSGATEWSPGSKNAINNFITPLVGGCLSACAGGPPLIADFDWNPDPGCQGQPVQFTDQSTGNITSRSWTFPSGSPPTSTMTNPAVTWNTGGTFNVSLTVSGPAGSNTKVKPVLIKPIPTANFTYTVNGLTVNFNNTSQNGTSYNWSFGDGGTSNEEDPEYTYTEAGFYTVILTVTNECGSATKSLVVNTAPTADFSASPTSGCASLIVNFTNESSYNASTFNWSFQGGQPGASNLQNPIVLYTISGSFTVSLTVTNASGSSSVVKTNYISVQTVPNTNFNFTANGLTVTFTNSTTGGTSYNWSFGDGASSNETNPVHTYAAGGSYTVTLTSTNPCGSTTATQTVVIVTPPTAGFTATPTSGCASLTVQFTNTSSPNATTWNWSFPGGTPSSSTAQNPAVVYNTAGTYSVTLTVSNAAGSSTASQTNYITVNTVPTTGFTNSISGKTVTFTNTSMNAASYLWNFGDGQTSTLTNPVHTYASDGTYTVTLTSTNPCGSTTATQTVVIVTPPTAGFTATPTSGCASLTVQFTNTSSPNATTWNWSFPGGTPSSSTAQNPAVVYNTAGTYSVTLIASNSAYSDTLTLTNYITVNTVPTAGFTSSVDSLTATFTNTSNNATSYLWNFGDGQTSTLTNPVHTYSNDGTYTVTLSATNVCGVTIFTQNVVIITAPSAGFTANTTTGCAPLTVQFQNLSSANSVSWSWSFPGGTPSSSTEQHPLVIYNTPGVYNVSLTVTNSAGTTSTFTQTNFITVLGPPTASFILSINGLTASFTNGSQNANSYSWAFGDGSTSMEANPTHTYLNGGTFTVTLSATNNCGTTTYTQEIIVEPAPVAAFTMSASEGCVPFTVQFTNQSSPNATSLLWIFEGGDPATSNQENPSATWSQTGTFLVTLIASNPSGIDTASATVTVNNIPTAGFTHTTAGLSVVLTNQSSNADSYLWNFGDGNTSNEANPTHNYGATGTFTVTLQATNECGTALFSSTVTISGSAPLAVFSVGENNGCVPFNVTFTDQSAGNPTAWQWTFPGGFPATSSEQNPTVTYSSTGVFPATLIATNIYGSDTLTLQNAVTAQSVPTSGFTYSANLGTITFNNQSLNASTFMWNFGDGNSSSETNPVHNYTANGTYTVELTAINVCGASTIQQIITVIVVGTNEVPWLNEFHLYPNPNTGAFTLEMSGLPHDEIEFVLFNAIGQTVKREVADFGTGTLLRNFDYGQLPAGVYHFRINAGESAMVVKVVVQR
jgi:PKD repeat protein